MCVCVCVCVCICVCVCVCSPPRLLITNSVIWAPYNWLNKLYSFYMAAVFIINSGHGLIIEVHHRNQPYKTKISLCKLLISLTVSKPGACLVS